MQIGIVGLPGVGKTTLFNALVRGNADVGGYAGAKNPNRSTIQVPDRRVALLSELFQPKKITFATVDYLDIAGITAGTGQKEEQGDSGLAALRNMDLLVHVLCGFEFLNAGSGAPKADYETTALELALADLEIIERRLERLEKEVRLKKSPEQIKERDLLQQCREVLEHGGALRDLDLSAQDEKILRGFRFLTQKPMMIVLNIGEQDIGNEQACLDRLGDLTTRLEALALCAKAEMEIAQLDETDQQAFLDDLGIAEPALTRMIITSYRVLNLISFFTVSEHEVRAWTISEGTTALEAAGEIHSDMERGFIRAETVGWEDLLRCKGWAGARHEGLMRLEGKEYVVQDGDVMNIRFNV